MTHIQDTNAMSTATRRHLALGTSLLAMIAAVMPVSAMAQDTAAEPAPVTGQVVVAAERPGASEDAFQIRFRADTMVVTPVLNVGLVDSVRSIVAGRAAEFQGYSNYPGFITRGEIRVLRAGDSPDAAPLATIAVDGNGYARWDVPADAPEALYYVYRVYDAGDRFDETTAQELLVLAEPPANNMGDAVSRPNFGQIDETARRTIQLGQMMATVTGNAQAGDVVRVNGQPAALADNGRFAVQQIVSRRDGSMSVTIERGGVVVREATQSFAAVRDDWFYVGQGELTLGTSFSRGPAELVSGDSLASGDYLIGRGAFYVSGLLADDVRLTASLDTGEALVRDLFSNLDRRDPRQLLRRLDSTQYYPTYGDDSTLVEDAPTQGRFYLRLRHADSQFVIGNFVTSVNGAELAQLDRGLFGALLDYNSVPTTSFGERRTQVTLFASDPGTVPGREEFRGTGGSLYFLQRQDVSIGSERLRVEVRDRETGLVLESRDLHPQQDYDFDAFQGRITLLRPLASTVADGATVREGSSTGNVPVLVVRYEYTPPVGSLDGYTLGGRATQWLGDTLRIGFTAQRDTVEEASQTLFGADVMLRITAGSYLKAEIAETDGPGFDQANSVDGGLSFTNIANPGIVGRAQAWRTEFAADFAELAGRSGDAGNVSAYYEHFDRGFASSGRLSPAETERYGGAISVPLGSAVNLAARYDTLFSADAGRSETATVDLAGRFATGGGAITSTVGLRYEDRVAGQLFNSVTVGSRTDLAAELEYARTLAGWSVFGFAQTTLDRDATRNDNDRFGGGLRMELTERLSIASEVSGGDGGLGADVQLNHRLAEGSEAYVGYALFADRTDVGLDTQNIFTRSNRGTLTLGARHRFSDALSLHGENRIGFGGTAPSLIRSYGLRFAPTARLSFTGSFENGQIDDATTGLFRRTAASVGVGYVDTAVRLGSSIELRNDRGLGRDRTVWLMRNDVAYAVNPDWRFVGRLNLARADNESPSIRAAEFTEAVAGFAYRPVDNERLNALVRVQYFEDLGPVGQITGSARSKPASAVRRRQRRCVLRPFGTSDAWRALCLAQRAGVAGPRQRCVRAL
ncbi:MAG: hypothetical protein HC774_01140 [Sphingomonadales bacterium]|nr:hypothetical protein [Sphingomonadales bacterium]